MNLISLIFVPIGRIEDASAKILVLSSEIVSLSVIGKSLTTISIELLELCRPNLKYLSI